MKIRKFGSKEEFRDVVSGCIERNACYWCSAGARVAWRLTGGTIWFENDQGDIRRVEADISDGIIHIRCYQTSADEARKDLAVYGDN